MYFTFVSQYLHKIENKNFMTGRFVIGWWIFIGTNLEVIPTGEIL